MAAPWPVCGEGMISSAPCMSGVWEVSGRSGPVYETDRPACSCGTPRQGANMVTDPCENIVTGPAGPLWPEPERQQHDGGYGRMHHQRNVDR